MAFYRRDADINDTGEECKYCAAFPGSQHYSDCDRPKIDDDEEAAAQREVASYLRANGLTPVEDFRRKDPEYLNPAPKPFDVQISLVEFFERVKRHHADAWQIDFCQRLENAAVGRPEKPTWAIVHAEAQLGKSIILAQCYPAWLLGHDPMHRIALATYNVSRSQTHSRSVIGIMNLPIYKEIFRNSDSYVPQKASKEKWQTEARRNSTDAQDSFNPVGLQSGITGSGFDTLIIDDPYASERDAFSEAIRKSIQSFWDADVGSRISEHSNVFGMFHRYHVQDLAGYLLDTGSFDYWRYASIADGPYLHEETGQRFEDPLGREPGEYISPTRRGPSYYVKKQKHTRTWNSMFQGKPTSDEGEFFNVGKIKMISVDEGARRREECIVLVRAWDNAATKDGGDTTAGFLGGIRADGGFTIFDVEMLQADSSRRLDRQRELAEADGPEVLVGIPKDPGSAGKDVVFLTGQLLEGYTVVERPTSQAKTDRALNFSYAVNSGDVEMVEGEWNKRVKTSLRDFPLSDFDDPVDAGGDCYNIAYEIFRKGLVIKNFKPQRNLTTWQSFATVFGATEGRNGTSQIKPIEKVPANFTVYVGVKITPNASQPNAAAIVVRPPQKANMPDHLFLIAEYKKWSADFYDLFTWIDDALKAYCDAPKKTAQLWLHPDSEQYRHTIWQKLQVPVAIFQSDETAGITELDWHLKPTDKPSVFNPGENGTRFLGVVSDLEQMNAATDEFGLYAFRQEARTWGYNDKGEPNAIGAVMECIRLVTYAFRTVSTGLTHTEKVEAALAPQLQVESLNKMADSPEKDMLLQRRNLEMKKAEQKVGKPDRPAHVSRFARR